MAIRIARNDAGNCINFFGSSNPTYWNACLVGEINEDNGNNVNVINSVRSEESGATVYEFFNLPYTQFVDKDNNAFENASECAEYITENANVLSNTGTFIFSQNDVLDAQREDTNTTVLFSNGDIYAVNSLSATAASDGTITISTVRGNKNVYTKLRYYNTSVNNGGITGFNTLAAAVDRLNEVLSGGTITSDLGNASSEESTQSTGATFTVYGSRITETGTGTRLGYTSTAEAGNFDTSNGFYSNQTINEPGEYYEFSQEGGNWDNTTGLTFGLFDETTYDVADLDEDVAGNAVKSVLRLRLKNTPFTFKDPASTLGRLDEEGFTSTVNTVEQWRVGLDADNRPYISAYINSEWTVVCRTETAAATGTEFRFVAVMPLANELRGIRNMTVNTIIPAPSLTWYFIESPDGSFDYPLFSTPLEANYADEEYGTAVDGAGASHTHTYVDETPTSQVWYMPQSYAFHNQSSAPTPPTGVVYNEITTGDDANYAPTSYGTQTLTVDENSTVNFQIKPAGEVATYNVTGIPAGLVYNSTSGTITGTAPEVAGNNTDNPSDEYTITITKANDYGSSVGTLTLTVTNLTVPSAPITGWSHVTGSIGLVDSDTLDNGTAVNFNDEIGDERRFKINKFFGKDQIIPALTEANDTVYIGVAKSTATWGSIDDADWEIAFKYTYVSATSIGVAVVNNGTAGSTTTQSHNATDGTNFNYYFNNKTGVVEALAKQNGQGGDAELSNTDGGVWTISGTRDTGVTGNKTITVAAVNTQMDISSTGLSEFNAPTPPTILTDWDKAVDFSGSNEHLKQVSSSYYYNAIQMGGQARLVNANTAATGKTSNDDYARPWATCIVFKIDGNNSNQHIWNQGSGASSSADNIALRLSASKNLYLYWGRQNAENECQITSGGTLATNQWYAIYIAHNGVRLSASNATAANLADCFDIRMMSSDDDFAALGSNLSTSSTWLNTGDRMDRGITGDFTSGGRGGNRNFHGKVASMVVTTLLRNQDMPTDAEIKTMITDPVKWLNDYKVGNDYRLPSSQAVTTNFQLNAVYGYYATQVWLMGDGTSDSFANGIRNYAYPSDQNRGKLQLNSMASNDIQNVTISGLT